MYFVCTHESRLNEMILLSTSNDSVLIDKKFRPQDKRAKSILIFLSSNKNINCVCFKELSQGEGPFEHPKHMFN